jgi:integrase
MIKALQAHERDLLIAAGDRLGLYLRVRAATGRKMWVIRRRVGGAWRVETIGEWPKMSARAAQAAAAGSTGAPERAVTFREALPDFKREVIAVRYQAAPREVAAYLERDCVSLHSRRLDRIRAADIAAVVTAKAATPNAATKLLVIVKQFFGWAVLTGRLTVDPAAGLTAKRLHIAAYEPRERTLTADEVRALWAVPDEPYGRLLRFTLLTACRIGEAIAYRPSQLAGDVWTIPVTKNGRPHSLPLSVSALELVDEGWPRRTYEALHSWFQASGVDWRPHDLRRTAATMMRDAGVEIVTIEAALNHTPPRLVRTYQRPDMLPAMRDAVVRLEATVLATVKGSNE